MKRFWITAVIGCLAAAAFAQAPARTGSDPARGQTSSAPPAASTGPGGLIPGGLVPGATPASEPAGKPRGESDVTVITSDRLTFDYTKHYALFEQNVIVTDPEMQLAADRLKADFDEAGKVQSIRAEGRVTITQADKTAQSGMATYDVASGKIVLAVKPRVTRGRDTLEGEQITFWRNENRMICQPQARLVIFPGDGGVKDQFGRGE